MLLPPFTILIIKKAHRPVTIQVTAVFMVAVFCVLVLGIFTATTLQHSFSGTANVLSLAEDRGPSRYVLAETDGDADVEPPSESPEITDITMERPRNGDIELSFVIGTMNQDTELYVWLILNPDARGASAPEVIPRNPLFRGVPVDFRNGIRHAPADDTKLKITLTGHDDITEVERVRILAYTSDGDMVIDHTVSVQQLSAL